MDQAIAAYATLAERWFDAWNARDIDAILALYADQVEFHSPVIATTGFNDTGILKTKLQLENYLRAVLPKASTLRFTPVGSCVGVGVHTLVYRTQTGAIVAETHRYTDHGLILFSTVAYDSDPIS